MAFTGIGDGTHAISASQLIARAIRHPTEEQHCRLSWTNIRDWMTLFREGTVGTLTKSVPAGFASRHDGRGFAVKNRKWGFSSEHAACTSASLDCQSAGWVPAFVRDKADEPAKAAPASGVNAEPPQGATSSTS